MLCVIFGSNWPSGYGEKDFKKLFMYLTMPLLSQLGKKKYNFHLIRRKLHVPSPNDAWYQLIELGTIYPRCLAVRPAD